MSLGNAPSRVARRLHHNTIFHRSSTRSNSTNMASIQDAIAAIERMGDRTSFSYTKVAKNFKVDCSTLARRHKGKQAPRAAKAVLQQKLNSQQKEELIIYIAKLTERELPSTYEMIKNFASAVAESHIREI
jgi:hypothetical protein